MGYPDREPRSEVEQVIELALLMDFLLAERPMLLSESDRKKLQGAAITINDVKDTSSGSGIIQEVEFTIDDGTTFMWDRRLPAAIAHGRIKGQRGLLLTGTVFSPRSLERTGIDPRDVDFFSVLIRDLPGNFSEFDGSLGFYLTRQSPDSYHLTLGGTHPNSIVSKEISGQNKPFQVARALNAAVRMHVPRM